MKKARRCSILVCGAGPAGSSAALAAARAGAGVLVLERRRLVGVPVRCAEYIPAPLAGSVPGGKGYIVQKTTSMRAFLHGECIQNIAAPGCVIRRDLFDQALARAAQEAGARVLTGQNLLGLEDAEGGRILVHAEAADGTKWDILADIVIGADGPKSRVGAHVNGTNWQMIPALQVTLPLVTPLDHTRVYFDERLCAGYAWLFPKGDVANVGLGAVPNADRGTLAKDLKAFVEAMIREELVTKGVRPTCTGGWIPVQERPCVRGNILLAGDAAGHTHPITGAGIAQAVQAGEMAGRWAARALGEGNMGLVNSYAEEWQDYYGAVLSHARKRRLAWEAHSGSLDGAIRSFWIGYREYYAA